MPRVKKPKKQELYGHYPGLNANEIAYVRFRTNPDNILKGYTCEETGEILGLCKRSIVSYNQKPEVREAITKEMMLKAADDLPDMLRDLVEQALGRGKYADAKAGERIQAKKLWFSIFGLDEEAREHNKKAKKEVNTSLEARLRELDGKYDRQDSVEAQE